MNYYDELGLAPDAPDEDIRKAHRTLSKLLHPDLQRDPAAREAAELQMRRINAMVATLLDPQRRREYDASLRGGAPPVVFVRPGEREHPRRWRFGGSVSTLLLTVTAGLLLTVAVVWLLDGDFVHFQTAGNPATPPANGPPATARQPAPAPTPASPRPAAPVARANNRMAQPPLKAGGAGEPRPDAVAAPVVSPPGPAGQPAAEPMAPAPRQAVLAEPPPQPVRAPPAAPAPTPGDSLAGWWLYAPQSPQAGAKTALYAPEYIQLRIRAEDGLLRGEYAARYRVSDRALSGEVAFHFQGKAGGDRSYPWQSDDGSIGVVELKMLTAESMQVSWRVGHFGTRLGLGAGTAVLIRKSEE